MSPADESGPAEWPALAAPSSPVAVPTSCRKIDDFTDPGGVRCNDAAVCGAIRKGTVMLTSTPLTRLATGVVTAACLACGTAAPGLADKPGLIPGTIDCTPFTAGKWVNSVPAARGRAPLPGRRLREGLYVYGRRCLREEVHQGEDQEHGEARAARRRRPRRAEGLQVHLGDCPEPHRLPGRLHRAPPSARARRRSRGGRSTTRNSGQILLTTSAATPASTPVSSRSRLIAPTRSPAFTRSTTSMGIPSSACS